MNILAALVCLFSESAVAQNINSEIRKCEAKNSLQKVSGKATKACALPTEKDRVIHKQLCTDPVGYVCSQNSKGQVLNSKCQIDIHNLTDVMQTDEYAKLNVAKIKMRDDLYARHKNECAEVKNAADCRTFLQVLHADELSKAEVALVYTAQKVKKLKLFFEQAKNAALQVIGSSTQMSEEAKKLAIESLENTTFVDPRTQHEMCAISGSWPPSTAILNRGHSLTESHEVVVCQGSALLLDHIPDSELTLMFGHELAHSVDVCSFDQLAAITNNVKVNGSHVYPKTISCLSANLHANSPQNLAEYCADWAQEDGRRNSASCLEKVEASPNCSWSADSRHDADTDDSSDYRKGGFPVGQIQESFSDFFGAQVLASVQKDFDTNCTNQNDVLIGLSSGFASLHGVCLKENTTDAHPPGAIRMTNNVLSNPALGALLCGDLPRKQCDSL